MNTYAIRRKHAWQSPDEVEQVAARSKQVADDEFPSDIRWIRSYVIAEEDGLGIDLHLPGDRPRGRAQARTSGRHARGRDPRVADMVVIRPDPERAAAA